MTINKISKLRKSARGRECQIRIPGYCNHDNDTVVLAHLNGGGMGMKNPDLFGSFACSSCHDIVDYRGRCHYPPSEIKMMFNDGIFRTQQIWIKEGLVKYE